MFVATTLLYPCAFALLCVGTGLLVDRLSGRWLPAMLLPVIGLAALIAVSQLTTYAAPIARATPYVCCAVAIAGFALRADRVRALVAGAREQRWALAVGPIAYAIALAPVLLAGRPTFSSYTVLSDSAVHMLGADYLLHHGQDYSHLDLRNSYGQYVAGYYEQAYPSGADTLFGGSALLLGLPLIWAFQPFCAFVLASASGPAWVLVRRMGLDGAWAGLGSLSVTLPALVYGYELVGSIKEITSLAMILALGALVVVHARWIAGEARRAIPFAIVVAAGTSALGVGFGVWALATAAVLGALILLELQAGRLHARAAAGLIATGALVALVCAWPTWAHFSKSLHFAQTIASTGNPGNLRTPLHTTQLLGIWLNGSYKQLPTGADRTATYLLIAIAILACLLGAIHLLRRREYPLLGWLALVLLAWLLLSRFSTTWVQGKGLMLTSPAVVLLAWGAVAALRESERGALALGAAAALLALVLAGGTIASDAQQYHTTDLAPTARYEELASVNSRFAGRGPALFTDFDEYALYELRDLDVGGPDFEAAPPALSAAGQGYRYPVELARAPPAALAAYPLIVTRRDPSLERPPAAYSLLWQGTYYQVWGRRRGAPAAIGALALAGTDPAQCAAVGRLAGLAARSGGRLVADPAPALVRVPLARSSHPAAWGRQREGLVMSSPGRLRSTFYLPRSGVWEMWLEGQLMPGVSVQVDGRTVASRGGQLDGNSVVTNAITPLALALASGSHRLSVTRTSFSLAPGNGGSEVLYGVFLVPRANGAANSLTTITPARWPSLCETSYQWVEAIAG